MWGPLLLLRDGGGGEIIHMMHMISALDAAFTLVETGSKCDTWCELCAGEGEVEEQGRWRWEQGRGNFRAASAAQGRWRPLHNMI